MSLTSTIQNAVASAFTAIDDLTQLITYNAPGSTVYNPTTGKNETAGTATVVRAVFISQPYRYDNSSNVEEGSPQILIKTADFSSALSVNGSFLVSGVRYDITSWSTDPANALYTIEVARSTS